jgi:hypothetical protein
VIFRGLMFVTGILIGGFHGCQAYQARHPLLELTPSNLAILMLSRAPASRWQLRLPALEGLSSRIEGPSRGPEHQPHAGSPTTDSTLQPMVGRQNAHICCRLWAGRMRISFVDCGPAACAYILSIVGRRHAHIFCRLWASGMRRWFDNSNDPTEAAPAHPVRFAKPYFQGVSFSFYTCSNFGLTGGPGREQVFPGLVLQFVAASLSLHYCFSTCNFGLQLYSHQMFVRHWEALLAQVTNFSIMICMCSGTLF